MSRPWYRWLLMVLALVPNRLTFAINDGTPAERNRFDIAAIDRALAEPVSAQGTVPFGDTMVLVTVLQEARARLAGGLGTNATTKPTSAYKWPGGNVYYRFDFTTDISAAKQTEFRDSVAEWAAFAKLTFIEFTTPLPANYITVRDDPTLTGGISSFIGMAGGEQFIRLSPTSWNRYTICHEMGHALGYYHEQQRSDRDNYVTILSGNIMPGQEGNFAKINPTTTYGAYDFLSVMQYGRHTWATPATADTIQPLPAYSQFLDLMGNVYYRTLSKLDRAGMAAIYGAPALAPSAVVTNTRDGGAGSLRTAIYYTFDQSIDTPGAVTPVTFHIPTSDPGFSGGVFKIQPTAGLVAPGDGAVIDGASQTAFTGDTNTNGPEIWLDGSALTTVGMFAPGLRLLNANCTVRNLCLSNFNQDGILLDGVAATGNVISGCYCGTDPAGVAAAPNAFSGIRFINGAHANTVGGLTAAGRNVLSGNTQHGVSISGTGTSGNIVQGNLIGLNAAGTAAVPNHFLGISIFSAAAANLIGGTAAGAGNVISGNLRHGVLMTDAGTDGNMLQGNMIGLNPAGTTKIGNGTEDAAQRFFYPGVLITGGARNTLIGGTAPGARNVISGNALQGVSISAAGTTGNLIQGNYIGLNAAGTAALGNGFADAGAGNLYSGVALFAAAAGNSVSDNLISGNAAHGVQLSQAGTSGNVVRGNSIGVNITGTAALPNAFSGVAVFGAATNNTIGGSAAGDGNVISGNNNSGVAITGAGTATNVVRGNYIGVNASGTTALPNAYSGVAVFGAATNNTVGGTAAGDGNVISGNNNSGVFVTDTGTTANVVQGNLIGLNAAGSASIANAFAGVTIANAASSNTIGGTATGSRNWISGNTQAGVAIHDAGTNSNNVQGNTIGLNRAGTVLGNGTGFPGVYLYNSAQGNLIGGSPLGAANLIAGNQSRGVLVQSSSGNTISRNSITNNGGAGISLGSGNPPAPALNSCVLGPAGNLGGTTVAGSLNGSANSSYAIEFFANPAVDDSGFGEGEFFLGSAVVTTNGSGTASFGVPLAAAVPSGYTVAATATSSTGDTSGFSTARSVTISDADGDGIPDAYETAKGFTAGDANRDADGDGLSNKAEFYAGTDPLQPASSLRVAALALTDGSLHLTFPSIAGKTYRLETAPSLGVPITWSMVTDQIFGTGSPLELTVPVTPAAMLQSYFRVVVEP